MRATTLPGAEQRIKVVDVRKYGIQGYDSDNAYPQRIDDLVKASPTTGACVGTYAKFIRGSGFRDMAFYKAVVNDQGLTCDKLLRRLTDDFAKYRGFAIQVNYNALYQKTELNYVPFENCRLGLEETEFEGKIVVYPDWTRRKGKQIKTADIDYLDPYNPDPEVIELQVLEAGGFENWKGQLLYYSADYECYPLASCDPVLESVMAEIDSDRTTRNNLKYNFAAKSAYIQKGKFEDEDEKDEFKRELDKFIGPEGRNVILVEVEDESEIPEIRNIESNMNDKLFQYTDDKVIRKILRNYQVPAILLSITDGGYFNQQQLQDAAEYYNLVTLDERNLFEETFRDLSTDFARELSSSGDFSITPISYGTVNNPQ